MRRRGSAAHRGLSLAATVAVVLGCAASTDQDRERSRAVTGESWTRTRDSAVRIESDSGRVLAGTFTRPTADRAPAVLLLSGSGPQDRDGARPELPGYLPLRDLADSLGRSGFAVLRLDDRGVGGSTGDFSGATTLDFARDAGRAVAWLRARSQVDSGRVALVGHSEGALVALLVASRDTTIAALALLGATARPGREVARWQRATLVAMDSSTWPANRRAAVLAAADSNAERTAALDPWLRTWFALDPREVARRVRSPVLLLHGESDRQVPSAQAGELARALRDGGATHVSVCLFPSTNHLLLEDRDGDPAAYVLLSSRRVRGDVLHAVARWLSAHAPR